MKLQEAARAVKDAKRRVKAVKKEARDARSALKQAKKALKKATKDAEAQKRAEKKAKKAEARAAAPKADARAAKDEHAAAAKPTRAAKSAIKTPKVRKTAAPRKKKAARAAIVPASAVSKPGNGNGTGAMASGRRTKRSPSTAPARSRYGAVTRVIVKLHRHRVDRDLSAGRRPWSSRPRACSGQVRRHGGDRRRSCDRPRAETVQVACGLERKRRATAMVSKRPTRA